MEGNTKPTSSSSVGSPPPKSVPPESESMQPMDNLNIYLFPSEHTQGKDVISADTTSSIKALLQTKIETTSSGNLVFSANGADAQSAGKLKRQQQGYSQRSSATKTPYRKTPIKPNNRSVNRLATTANSNNNASAAQSKGGDSEVSALHDLFRTQTANNNNTEPIKQDITEPFKGDKRRRSEEFPPLSKRNKEDETNMEGAKMLENNNQEMETADISSESEEDEDTTLTLTEPDNEATNMSNPKSMSLEVVFSMFQRLQEDITQIKKDRLGTRLQKLEKKDKEKTDEIEAIKYQQLKQQDKIDKLTKDVDLFKTKSEIMAGMIQKMSIQLNEHSSKHTQTEQDRAKCTVMIRNLYSGSTPWEIKQSVYWLFSKMGLQMQIYDAYTQGQDTPKTIIVVMHSSEDKKKIFQNIANIASLKNQDGKKYILKDFYTQTSLDKQHRHTQIYNMFADNPGQQEKIKVTEKGDLMIGPQKYAKKVIAPTPQEILQLSLEEMRQILSMSISAGKPVYEQGSHFQGFTAAVQTHQQIRQLYTKLKLTHADARHIVCAYSIPGTDLHHCNDYYDDEEVGTGKFLLKLLLDNHITSRVIFVVRYCYGQKVGMVRHNRFLEAATNAVNANPYNKFIAGDQQIMPRTDTRLAFTDGKPFFPKKRKVNKTSTSTRGGLGASRGRQNNNTRQLNPPQPVAHVPSQTSIRGRATTTQMTPHQSIRGQYHGYFTPTGSSYSNSPVHTAWADIDANDEASERWNDVE